MMNQQMEISFENVRVCRSANRRQRRLSRANWWFDRMRKVVDKAMDWQPSSPPRPEQIWFQG